MCSGEPPHIAAVTFDGKSWRFTHMEVPPKVVGSFRRRKDSQIMGLELLAIALSLNTFRDLLMHRSVVVHSDNTGSEVTCVTVIVTFVSLACCCDR